MTTLLEGAMALIFVVGALLGLALLTLVFKELLH